MGKKYDVTALGELLIDFTSSGLSEQGNPLFEANPGGAPCNVLAMLNKLGRKTAFIGKVGKDQFGQLLKDTIEEMGIDARGLLLDEKTHTTLAFVHTFPDGDREFSFYRNPGADMMLTAGWMRSFLSFIQRISTIPWKLRPMKLPEGTVFLFWEKATTRFFLIHRRNMGSPKKGRRWKKCTRKTWNLSPRRRRFFIWIPSMW